MFEALLRSASLAAGCRFINVLLFVLLLLLGLVIPNPSFAVTAIPGVIQAEDFDAGGEGVAYHDVTAENEGGAYRNEGVDIAPLDDGSGYYVGWIRSDEWMQYTINVAASGVYDVRIRYSTLGSGGIVTFKFGNVSLEADMRDTGGWQNWQTLLRSAVLTQGEQTLRISCGGASCANIDTIEITPYEGVPYAGSSLPLIEAENFDEGPDGIAYHDTHATNGGGAYRDTGVDIEADAGASNGYAVCCTFDTEWLNYTVDVTNPGLYRAAMRVASDGAGGSIGLETAAGMPRTSWLSVPDTGGWHVWDTVSGYVHFPVPGPQPLRIHMDRFSGAVGNVDSIEATRLDNVGNPYPRGTLDIMHIEAEDFDLGAEGVAYHDTGPANGGGAYRATGVDIEGDGGASNGYALCCTFAGEWLNYTVIVGTPGLKRLFVVVASAGPGGKFHIEYTGGRTETFTIPDTGGWHNWRDLKLGINFPVSGPQVLRLVMDENSPVTGAVGNFDYIAIRKIN